MSGAAHAPTKQSTFTLGHSVEGRDLLIQANFDLHASVSPPGITLLLGGVHGDEPAGTQLLLRFKMEHLVRGGITEPVIVWPVANPDGAARGTRYNARGVDLNRNCDFRWRAQGEGDEPSGDAAWSEPESRALRNLILLWRPAKIVTLHWALAELNGDGAQSAALLDKMWNAMTESERLPYRKWNAAAESDDMLPGSLGSWCGFGLTYPDGSRPAIVTIELPWDPAVRRGDMLPADHLNQLRRRWRADSSGYLAAVRPGVFKALRAACENSAESDGSVASV